MTVQEKIHQAALNQASQLDLADCGLTEVPSEVFELTHLEVLKLGGFFSDTQSGQKNNLRLLPDRVGALRNLKELYLLHNGLTTLPASLAELPQLRVLILTGNALTKVPPVVFALKNLELLYLTGNRLGRLSGEIGQLTHLKKLYLSRNQLEALPGEIGSLRELEELIADHNHLSTLPAGLENLESLRLLSLRHNRLTALPGTVARLENLREVLLDGNRISVLPAGLFALEKLRTVRILNNPLAVPPPEIAHQGVQVTKDYFHSVRDPGETGWLREVKLILLGNGEVGKTTLRENLMDPAYGLTPHPSTEGLEVKNWDFPLDAERTVRFNIWDFGGQGKYRMVQQHFFSRNAIYLYVTEPDDHALHAADQYVGVRYWLEFIKAFGNEVAPGQYPVIHVQNKCDQVPTLPAERDLAARFPEVSAFVRVSNKTGQGLTQLRDHLKALLLATNLVGVPINEKWLRVKSALERQTAPYLRYEAYLATAREQGLTDNEARLWLRYLVSVGSVLYFPHLLELQGYVFPKPNWIRLAAYRILAQGDEARAGTLSRNQLAALWAEHPAHEQRLLFQILKAFQLLAEAPEGGEGYVIPSLAGRAPALPARNKLKPNQMWVECRFQPFMPAGMVARLVVALYPQVHENLYWQDRVILQHAGAVGDVAEDWEAKKLILVLKGEARLPLLNLLLKTVQDIGFAAQRVKFSPHFVFGAYVLCRCEACGQSPSPYFHPFAHLQQLRGKKVAEAVCEASGHPVGLKTLFGEDTP